MQCIFLYISTFICINCENYFHKFSSFMAPQKFLILIYLQEYVTCNPGHHILTIYCLSVQVCLVISIRELISSITDFELPHELPNLPNQEIWEIRKYQKNLRIGRGHGQVYSLPSRSNFLPKVFKNYTETDIKVCCSCLIFLEFEIISISTQIFQKAFVIFLVNFFAPFSRLFMTFPV